MKKCFIAALAMLAAAAAWAADVTFSMKEFDASTQGLFRKSSGILDPDAGSISFTFTGKFDRYGKERGNIYKFFYSMHNRLAVAQLRPDVFRLYFYTRNEQGKSIAIEKVVKITPNTPFNVKLLWGKAGVRLFFNDQQLGNLPIYKINWGATFGFGGIGSESGMIRIAGGKFENIVISSGEENVVKPAAAVAGNVTFRKDSYEAFGNYFSSKSADILDPEAGAISFTFTGNFDRYGKERGNIYKLFYSMHNRLAVAQLRPDVFRLYFYTRNEQGKSIAIEKVVKITPNTPFNVKLLWGKAGVRLFFNDQLLGKLPLSRINWGATFGIGGIGSGSGMIRNAGGKFENFVISSGEETVVKPAAAVSGKVTFRQDRYEALNKYFVKKSSGILSPVAGSISFTFTGNFDRFGKEKYNLYTMFYSTHSRLGVQQLSPKVLRLFFHTKDENNKRVSIEKVVSIVPGKPFDVRLKWGDNSVKLFMNDTLIGSGSISRMTWSTNFGIGGIGDTQNPIRCANGVFENIIITDDTPVMKNAGVSVLMMDFENDDLKQWKLDQADGSEQRIKIDRKNYFTGQASLSVEKTNYPGDFEFKAPDITRIVVKKDVTYDLKVRYRLESITDATISAVFDFENAGGKVITSKPVVGGGRRNLNNFMRDEAMLPEKTWREFTAKFKAGQDGFLRFVVSGGDGIFKCNFDTVSAKPAVPAGNQVFFENFSALNIHSADALAGRDFIVDGAKLNKVKKGLQVTFPGNFIWKTALLNPLVEYRMTINSANVAAGATVTLEFRDAAEKVIAEYKRPLAPPCFLDFEVPATASLATLTVSGASGSAIIRSIAVDKNFTVNKERGIYNNEWQGYALWDGLERGKTAFRRTFTLEAAPQEAYARFLGHNGATLFVNGTNFGAGGQFAPGVVDVTKVVKAGKNVLALLVSCSSGGKKGMFELFVRDVNGREYFIVSDEKSRVYSGIPDKNWITVDYNDSQWKFAGVRDGSARDFGNSITAAIVNSKQESLYIGPRELLTVSDKKYTESFPADGIMTISLLGNIPEDVIGGRVVFVQGSRIFRLELAPQEISFDRKKLDVRFAPMFMPPGKYQCELELYRIRFADGITLKVGEVNIGAKKKPFRRPVAQVKRLNGKPILHVNGKPHPAGMFCAGRPYSPEVGEVNKNIGIKIYQIYINKRSMAAYISNADLIDDRSGKYDFSVTEQMLIDAAAQLRLDPDAYIFPLIGNVVPKDFATRADRQDDLIVTSKGYKLWVNGPKRLGKFGQPYRDMSELTDKNAMASVSHASQHKAQVYVDMIRATVEYFENSPLAEKIIGYGISGEMDAQLYPYIPYGGFVTRLGRGDYSVVMLKYFRNYLRKKYGTDAALQSAWNNADVTFDTAQIPSDAERAGANFFVSRAVADYVGAFSWAQLDLTNAMTRAIKDATKGRCLVWLYPSDGATVSGVIHYGYHAFNVTTGHAMYNESSVDMFGNPGHYTLRRNGLSSGQFGAPGSANMGNKIWSPEMDLRSFVIGAYSTSWGPDTLFASQSHWAKEMMTTLRHGMGFRVYTFWKGWFNNQGVMDEMALLQKISKKQLELPLRWKPEVCLLMDTDAIKYTGDFTDRRMHFFLRATGGFCAAEISTSGAQYDIYYLQDILKDDFPADQYKVYIFNGTYRINPEMLAAIHKKLHGKGKTLIWRWGDGYLDKHNKAVPSAVEQLTGFKVKSFAHGKALPTAMVNNEKSPYTSGMQNASVAAKYRYNCDAAIPYFVLDDPNAKVLANFPGGEAALGVKNVRGAVSIYAALPAVPARMLRNIFREAGIHIYVNNDHDFISTDGNFLSLHSGVGGAKTVYLPEKVAEVVDMHSGKVIARNSNEIKFDLRANGTAIFEIKR